MYYSLCPQIIDVFSIICTKNINYLGMEGVRVYRTSAPRTAGIYLHPYINSMTLSHAIIHRLLCSGTIVRVQLSIKIVDQSFRTHNFVFYTHMYMFCKLIMIYEVFTSCGHLLEIAYMKTCCTELIINTIKIYIY
jgi:hypothetical protein